MSKNTANNTLAILGGNKTILDSFPSCPIFDEREFIAVKKVLESGQWWSDNNIIEEFEREFADFQQTKYALTCTNGTHAIELVLRALDIGAGDEVIVPAYTFIATVAAVSMVGASPILADISKDTMTLNVDSFLESISSRTKAIILVHLAGIIGNIDEILSIAKEKQIAVIEDCAHAHGSALNDRMVGNFGIAGTFSFQASKTITSGEGGAIVTNDKSLYQKCWALRNHGCSPQQPANHHLLPGSNFRLTPFQAAILRVQLQRFKEQAKLRINNANLLDKYLSHIDGIVPQYRSPAERTPGYIYIFYYQPEAFGNLSRDQFVKALRAEGVPCVKASYKAIHHSDAYRANAIKQFPNAEVVGQTTVWLPHQVLLGDAIQIQEIAEAISKIQQYFSSLVKQ